MTKEKAIKILSLYKNSYFGDAIHGGVISVSEIIELLSAHPEQEKGEWIPSENEMFVHCSNCGCQWESDLVKNCNMEFCPSCGKYNGGES